MFENLKKMLEALKRYSLAYDDLGQYMSSCKDGEYVEFDDIVEMIREIEEENEKK